MNSDVRNARREQEQLDALHRLDEECVHLQRAGNYLQAFDRMERALVLRRHFFGADSAEVAHACRALAEMCNLLSMSFLQQDNYAVALELLKKAEILSQHHPRDRATTLNNLACYYRRLGKLHTALTCLKKALAIETRTLHDARHAADTHLNMCAVLSQLNQHAAALEHAQAALITLQSEFFEAQKDPGQDAANLERVSVLCIAYHNVGVEQEFLKDYEASVLSYKKGVGLAEQYLGLDHTIATTIRNSYLAAKRTISTKAASVRHASRAGGQRVAPLKPRAATPPTSLRLPSPITRAKQQQLNTQQLPSPRSIVADALAKGHTLPPIDTAPNKRCLAPEDPFFSPRYRFDANANAPIKVLKKQSVDKKASEDTRVKSDGMAEDSVGIEHSVAKTPTSEPDRGVIESSDESESITQAELGSREVADTLQASAVKGIPQTSETSTVEEPLIGDRELVDLQVAEHEDWEIQTSEDVGIAEVLSHECPPDNLKVVLMGESGECFSLPDIQGELLEASETAHIFELSPQESSSDNHVEEASEVRSPESPSWEVGQGVEDPQQPQAAGLFHVESEISLLPHSTEIQHLEPMPVTNHCVEAPLTIETSSESHDTNHDAQKALQASNSEPNASDDNSKIIPFQAEPIDLRDRRIEHQSDEVQSVEVKVDEDNVSDDRTLLDDDMQPDASSLQLGGNEDIVSDDHTLLDDDGQPDASSLQLNGNELTEDVVPRDVGEQRTPEYPLFLPEQELSDDQYISSYSIEQNEPDPHDVDAYKIEVAGAVDPNHGALLAESSEYAEGVEPFADPTMLPEESGYEFARDNGTKSLTQEGKHYQQALLLDEPPRLELAWPNHNIGDAEQTRDPYYDVNSADAIARVEDPLIRARLDLDPNDDSHNDYISANDAPDDLDNHEPQQEVVSPSIDTEVQLAVTELAIRQHSLMQ